MADQLPVTVAARTWALLTVTLMVSVVFLGAALVRRARRRIVPPGRGGTVVELTDGLVVTTVSVPGNESADSFPGLLHASILKAPELDAATVNVAEVMTSVPVFTTVKKSAGSFSPLPLPVAPPFAYVKTGDEEVEACLRVGRAGSWRHLGLQPAGSEWDPIGRRAAAAFAGTA